MTGRPEAMVSASFTGGSPPVPIPPSPLSMTTRSPRARSTGTRRQLRDLTEPGRRSSALHGAPPGQQHRPPLTPRQPPSDRGPLSCGGVSEFAEEGVALSGQPAPPATWPSDRGDPSARDGGLSSLAMPVDFYRNFYRTG
jgi:hypothetical protein